MLAAAVVGLLGQDASAWMRNSVQWLFAPAGDVGMYVTTVLKSNVGDDEQTRLTPAQVRKLIQERDYYRSRYLERWRQYQQLNQTLLQRQQIFGELQRAGAYCSLIEGRVIATDSLPYGRHRAINVGRAQGADVGSFATTRIVSLPTRKALPTHHPPAALLKQQVKLAQQVLVGRVVESWAFGARIQLVTDRGFAIPANVQRILDPENPRFYVDLERGVRRRLEPEDNPLVPISLRGDGANALVAANIPENHNIQAGDEIVTKDDRYFLPARIRIARITQVLQDPKRPRYVTLKAEPMADLPALREVFIVFPEYRRAEPGR
jgi:cell shape-determining protein MreC